MWSIDMRISSKKASIAVPVIFCYEKFDKIYFFMEINNSILILILIKFFFKRCLTIETEKASKINEVYTWQSLPLITKV